MKDLQVFEKDNWSIRSLERDGEPWFIGSDVCAAVGLDQVTIALDRLDDDEGALVEITHPQSPAKLLKVRAVSEAGLYSLILGSRKPEAKSFKRWVTHEVLPSIRRTGSYTNLPQTYSQALRALADQAEQVEAQKALLQIQAPKVEFYDAVTGSRDTVDIGVVAKLLNYPGYGRNNLFQLLRDEKILMESNIPFQRHVDSGCFRVIESKYNRPDGSTHVSFKTVVYQKGIELIRRTIESVEN